MTLSGEIQGHSNRYMTSKVEDFRCPACACENSCSYLSPYRNAIYKQKEAEIFSQLETQLCNACGFAFSYPPVSKKVLSTFYSSSYRESRNLHSSQLANCTEHSKYGFRGLAQLQLASLFIEQEKVLRILDIGSGPGACLRAAKKVYPKAKLYAIEPDQHCCIPLQNIGVQVLSNDLLTIDFSTNSQQFDLVIMSHVLEHYNYNDLIPVLKQLSRLLSDEGVAIIEVPYEGLDKKGSTENLNNAPHLSFFTEKSLKKLLEQFFVVEFCKSYGRKYSTPIAIQAPSFQHSNLQVLRARFKQLLKKVRFINKALEIRRKLKEPDFFSYAGTENYSYGTGRTAIRTVVRKKDNSQS